MTDLETFRDKLQSFCFWWSTDKRWRSCRERNGMDHVCAFCALAQELSEILAALGDLE